MIYATCIDCTNRVAVDEEETRLGIDGTPECHCVGEERCAGDDLSVDHRLDDPRRGQADDINRSNKR